MLVSVSMQSVEILLINFYLIRLKSPQFFYYTVYIVRIFIIIYNLEPVGHLNDFLKIFLIKSPEKLLENLRKIENVAMSRRLWSNFLQYTQHFLRFSVQFLYDFSMNSRSTFFFTSWKTSLHMAWRWETWPSLNPHENVKVLLLLHGCMVRNWICAMMITISPSSEC